MRQDDPPPSRLDICGKCHLSISVYLWGQHGVKARINLQKIAERGKLRIALAAVVKRAVTQEGEFGAVIFETVKVPGSVAWRIVVPTTLKRQRNFPIPTRLVDEFELLVVKRNVDHLPIHGSQKRA
jgi:hypothetical protein